MALRRRRLRPAEGGGGKVTNHCSLTNQVTNGRGRDVAGAGWSKGAGRAHWRCRDDVTVATLPTLVGTPLSRPPIGSVPALPGQYPLLPARVVHFTLLTLIMTKYLPRAIPFFTRLVTTATPLPLPAVKKTTPRRY